MSSSVEDSDFMERLKQKRKEKEKAKDSKGKTKEGKDAKEDSKGKDDETTRRKRIPVARPACSFCHIPYREIVENINEIF